MPTFIIPDAPGLAHDRRGISAFFSRGETAKLLGMSPKALMKLAGELQFQLEHELAPRDFKSHTGMLVGRLYERRHDKELGATRWVERLWRRRHWSAEDEIGLRTHHHFQAPAASRLIFSTDQIYRMADHRGCRAEVQEKVAAAVKVFLDYLDRTS